MKIMEKDKELLEFLYSCGGTRRYHNRPKLNQNVREHSWGVALIISILHPNPSQNLLKAALFHDLHENKYSDLLAPLKNDFPEAKLLDEKCVNKFWQDLNGIEYPKLTEEEQLWLDFADVYECCLFTREENEEVYVYSLEKSRILGEKLQELGY